MLQDQPVDFCYLNRIRTTNGRADTTDVKKKLYKAQAAFERLQQQLMEKHTDIQTHQATPGDFRYFKVYDFAFLHGKT